MTRLLWLAHGGTLQARGHDATDRDRYWRTGEDVSPAELLRDWPVGLADVHVEQVAAGASHDLAPSYLLGLVRRLRELDPDEVDGVVVSLGSNGLEEVAFLLWFLGPAPVTVVLTAAMRPPTAIGTDATENLYAALTTAARLPRLATVVVSDGAVLDPVGLTKTHTGAVDSFRAGARVLGTATPAGPVVLDREPRVSPGSDLPVPVALAPVHLLTSVLGADGSLIRAAVATGAQGLVVAGLGAGFPPAPERAALLDAHHSGVAVCLARRTPYGRTVGPDDTAPFLSASDLTAVQARWVLALAPPDADLQSLLTLGVDARGRIRTPTSSNS